jgi:hypothetical protein
LRYEGHRHLLMAVLALLPLAVAFLAIVKQIETSQQLIIKRETESVIDSRSLSGYKWPELTKGRIDSLRKANQALYRQADRILIKK